MGQNRICELLGIRYPIIQAPMNWVSGADLVAAVSEAGGLGTLGPNSGAKKITPDIELTGERMRDQIRKVRSLTQAPFAVNIVAGFGEDLKYSKRIVEVVIEEAVPVAIVSVGRPDTYTGMLKEAGVDRVLAVNAVGGINAQHAPESLVIPDQIIDYSYGRDHTFFADDLDRVVHIDFTWPYTQALREKLLEAGNNCGLQPADGGVYACTQGPRLESAAEVRRLKQDGCDLVGMTGMPEAALAREAELDYASIAVVANWAAGLSEQELSMQQIEACLQKGMLSVKALIVEAVKLCN